jgi:hypothetical protein
VQAGTIDDLVNYMKDGYWAYVNQVQPWKSITNDQNNIVYYCTQPLDTQAEIDMAVAAMALWQDVADITLQSVDFPS